MYIFRIYSYDTYIYIYNIIYRTDDIPFLNYSPLRGFRNERQVSPSATSPQPCSSLTVPWLEICVEMCGLKVQAQGSCFMESDELHTPVFASWGSMTKNWTFPFFWILHFYSSQAYGDFRTRLSLRRTEHPKPPEVDGTHDWTPKWIRDRSDTKHGLFLLGCIILYLENYS